MQGNDYGSILIDRGDRDAFQGDGHPSMAAAEAVFGSPDIYELTRLALEVTDCHTPLGKKQVCRFKNGTVAMPRGSYPVYWTMSVCDYFWASGNIAEFNKLLPDVEAILGDQIAQFDACLLTDTTTQPDCNYEFIGWDDRTGIGGTALPGSISTVFTVLSWICVGIHSCRALSCPVCAYNGPIWC